MKAIRLIQGAAGVADLEVVDGQLSVGDPTEQNQYLLLVTHKGEWKEYPLQGVGLTDMVNDHDMEEWKRAIAEALEQDGQMIEKLELTTDKLTLKAKYKE